MQTATPDSYTVALAGRQGRRHGHQRPGPGLRRLLGQQPHVAPTTLAAADRSEHRRPAERQGRDAGAGSRAASRRRTPTRGGTAPTPVCGGHAHQRRRRRRRPTTARTTTRSSTTSRRRTRTTWPPASIQRGRPQPPGQPPVRPDRTSTRRWQADELPAVSFLKAAGVPGRPRGLLRPDRRAELPRQGDQRDPEVAGLEGHRHRHRLRRLRRLVRPRGFTRRRTPRTTPTERRGDLHRAPTAEASPAAIEDRCGPGPRLPLLVISPVRRRPTTSTTTRPSRPRSPKFIEDNWLTGRIGDASFDQRAGTLDSLFNFTASNNKRVILKSNGAVKSITPDQGALARTRKGPGTRSPGPFSRSGNRERAGGRTQHLHRLTSY